MGNAPSAARAGKSSSDNSVPLVDLARKPLPGHGTSSAARPSEGGPASLPPQRRAEGRRTGIRATGPVALLGPCAALLARARLYWHRARLYWATAPAGSLRAHSARAHLPAARKIRAAGALGCSNGFW